MVYKAQEIKEWNNLTLVNGIWSPARPASRGFVKRLKAAWLVLTGKYDALDWEHEPRF